LATWGSAAVSFFLFVFLLRPGSRHAGVGAGGGDWKVLPALAMQTGQEEENKAKITDKSWVGHLSNTKPHTAAT